MCKTQLSGEKGVYLLGFYPQDEWGENLLGQTPYAGVNMK